MLSVRGAAHSFPVGGTPISRRRAIGLVGSLVAAATINWHRNFDENRKSWTNWESLGGVLTSGPAAVAWGGDAGLPYHSYETQHLDVFILGNDRALWHRSLDHGRWSPWESVGGRGIVSDPAVASWGQGRLDVYVVTSNGQLWTRSHQA